jgi:hypothetical protein
MSTSFPIARTTNSQPYSQKGISKNKGVFMEKEYPRRKEY